MVLSGFRRDESSLDLGFNSHDRPPFFRTFIGDSVAFTYKSEISERDHAWAGKIFPLRFA
jgi:hypothetical protein